MSAPLNIPTDIVEFTVSREAFAVIQEALANPAKPTEALKKLMRFRTANIIELPWPPSELSPNAKRRKHWRVYQPIAKEYKALCVKLISQSVAGGTHLNITFLPPDKRRRDLDGMLGAFKHGIDAIAQVLGIDDYEFTIGLKRGEPVKGGRVIVSVE